MSIVGRIQGDQGRASQINDARLSCLVGNVDTSYVLARPWAGIGREEPSLAAYPQDDCFEVQSFDVPEVERMSSGAALVAVVDAGVDADADVGDAL
jgi:hypothetical protein